MKALEQLIEGNKRFGLDVSSSGVMKNAHLILSAPDSDSELKSSSSSPSSSPSLWMEAVSVEKKMALLKVIRMVVESGVKMENEREVMEAAMELEGHKDKKCGNEAMLTVKALLGSDVTVGKLERELRKEKEKKEKERKKKEAAQQQHQLLRK